MTANSWRYSDKKVFERALRMKKILLISTLLAVFMLPVFCEEQGMDTLEFANQTGELIGQAKVCGIDTTDVNQKLIEGITVLAKYRKQSVENALDVYKFFIQKQLGSPASSYNCSEVRYNFSQVQAKLAAPVGK